MKRVVLLVLVAAGCAPTPSAQPGTPVLIMGSDWIQREAVVGMLGWPSAVPCNSSGGSDECADGTVTILSMTCHGCFLVVDWTGTTIPSSNRIELVVAATQDGPVSLDVQMLFKPTGDLKTVTASAVADHEVALVAECRLIGASELAQLAPFATVADPGLRDCSTAPHPGDHVVVVPSITTQHGAPRFPFCLGSFPCTGPMGEQFRDLSSLVIAQPPELWAVSEAEQPGPFAVLPTLNHVLPIAISTTLATGETVVTSFTPPAIPSP